MPDVANAVRRALEADVAGTDTLLSIDTARRALGCEPTFTWRELF